MKTRAMARQRREESGGETNKFEVSLGSWRRRCSSDLGGTASGSGTGRGLAKKPPPAEASAASAATSRCSTNLRTSLKSTAPLVDVAGGTSWPLPLTGHCRPCKLKQQIQARKQQIQARNAGTSYSSSSLSQPRQNHEIHLAEMLEMSRHVWSSSEEDKLMKICERPAMIELYRTNRQRFYQDVSNEMNRGSHPNGFVQLTPEKIREKIKRLRDNYRQHHEDAAEMAKGNLPGFKQLFSFYDKFESVFSLFDSGSQATSSGSVLGKRKRFVKPWDLDSAAQYLVDCKKVEGISDVDLLRYSKALEDPSCLRMFLAHDNHDERMKFIKSSADTLVKL